MAQAGFEEVFFHGPLHEVVADGGFGDALVVGDGFVVVAFEGGDVGEFEVEFVGEAVNGIALASCCSHGAVQSTYASALSFSNQPAAVSYASIARFKSPISFSYSSARFCLCVAARRKLPFIV
jgi:hypothetical protein